MILNILYAKLANLIVVIKSCVFIKKLIRKVIFILIILNSEDNFFYEYGVFKGCKGE